ncbi:TetR/AcrR family transcriptional regulator [Kribbella soli]|uniref:TetR/AcrR family transcriptional regulator n=1 Tax=Kribbella soli TaxID=1124743 RepID=A0A4R0H404_9ACTN|nr:TetR/AcrR family transcriptional regulator [Kribbella soli]TCC05347.1 TetR/AcrR family transcriptional regulator [Kribbella soli]
MDSAVDRLLDGPAPRADARRNVERLVAAARAAVDEVGTAVTAHEIARRAGVGIGTFYRRVPSREALLEAVLAGAIDEMTELARAARAADDPWPAFCAFAADYIRLRATSCGLNEALGGAGGLALADRIDEFRKEFRGLVRRLQLFGVLRAGLTFRDIAFALAGVVPQARTLGMTADRTQWRRTLQIVLDGVRAT